MKPKILLLPLILLSALAAHADARSIAPGGCIWVPDPEGGPPTVCPLEHTEVDAQVSGSIARVTVTQRFGNPYPRPIEATYTFPLSERAAVDRMRMQVGDRVIRGEIKERGEAKRIYDAARERGQVTSLLDQERPNIFTQSVANIMPGESIEITLSYVEYLPYADGAYTFAFPMTVGPRYTPQSVRAEDADRINPPLAPEGVRAGHDIGLTLLIDAGAEIHAIDSELHAIDTERTGTNRAIIRLKNQKEIPNRDFILKYAVASAEIGDALLTHRKDKDGYFTLSLHPPARVTPKEATPKEMIFVIDSSGSMGGFPIEKAKATMARCVENMNPNDTFNLITFAGGMGYCFPETVANTQANRTKALAFLERLQGGGGTEMMPAIRASLAAPYSEKHLRVVCFMTDGFIGNEMDILAEIQKSSSNARVFAFGIGSSVNRFLIEGMAREGRGAAEIVTLESGSAAAAERFHERVHSPVLTDITIDFGDLPVEDLYPPLDRLPDLFSSQPITVTGRYTAAAEGTVTVHGSTANGRYKRTLDVDLPKKAIEHDVLAPLWARARIDALMAEDWQGMQRGNGNKDIETQITRLGLDYSLMTQYTSFVAVEERIVNKGGRTTRIEVPVEIPDGVSHDAFSDQVQLQSQIRTLGYLGAPQPAPMPTVAHRTVGIASSAPEPVSSASNFESTVSGGLPKVEVMEEAASAAEKVKTADRDDATLNAKIDSALQQLAAKLKDGNYAQGDVRVVDGKLKVFLHLSDLREANLNALRAAGIKIESVLRSSNTVLATIDADDIESIARFNFVTQITPPKF